MDDFEQLLGIQLSPEQAATLQEMARKANDRMRVYNPTDEDFYVAWDLAGSGGRFLIPNKSRDIGYGMGQAVHPRYIAFKYFKEMSGTILSKQLIEAVSKENADRVAKGFKPMDKSFDTQEEVRFSDPYRVDNPEKLRALLPVLILGIEEEWGLDSAPQQKSEAQVNWEEINNLVNRPARRPEDPLPTVEQPVVAAPAIEAEPVITEEAKQDLAQELSA